MVGNQPTQPRLPVRGGRPAEPRTPPLPIPKIDPRTAAAKFATPGSAQLQRRSRVLVDQSRVPPPQRMRLPSDGPRSVFRRRRRAGGPRRCQSRSGTDRYLAAPGARLDGLVESLLGYTGLPASPPQLPKGCRITAWRAVDEP